MTSLPLLRLWQYGTKTCWISPATESAPYQVVVHDGDDRIAERTFDTHNEAISFAVEALHRATSSSPASG